MEEVKRTDLTDVEMVMLILALSVLEDTPGMERTKHVIASIETKLNLMLYSSKVTPERIKSMLFTFEELVPDPSISAVLTDCIELINHAIEIRKKHGL